MSLNPRSISMLAFDWQDGCVSLTYNNLSTQVKEGGHTSIVVLTNDLGASRSEFALMAIKFFELFDSNRRGKPDTGKIGTNPLYIRLFWPSMIGEQTWESYLQTSLFQDAALMPNTKLSAHEIEDLIEDENFMEAARIILNANNMLSHDDAARRLAKSMLLRIGEFGPEYRGLDNRLKSVLYLCAMKDRPVAIGQSEAMQTLLVDLMATGVPLHLMAHSFGATLMLEALKKYPASASGRKPYSLTLIQPAVSRWAFSIEGQEYTCPNKITTKGPRIETNLPHAYHACLYKTEAPILVLFSDDDPLVRYTVPCANGHAIWIPVPCRGGDNKPPFREDVCCSDREKDDGQESYATLGAHGPDMIYSEDPFRTGMSPTFQTNQTVVENPKWLERVRVFGVRGMWGHGGTLRDQGWIDNKILARCVFVHMACGKVWRDVDFVTGKF